MQMRLVGMAPGQAVVMKERDYSWEDGVLTIVLEDGETVHYSLAVVEWFKP